MITSNYCITRYNSELDFKRMCSKERYLTETSTRTTSINLVSFIESLLLDLKDKNSIINMFSCNYVVCSHKRDILESLHEVVYNLPMSVISLIVSAAIQEIQTLGGC